jgi:integrating conjugative element protein (TIGR03757 family)
MTALSDFSASLTSLVLAVSLSLGDVAWAASQRREQVRVELFTGHNPTMQPVRRGEAALATKIEVYDIDGIARLEAILSERLPSDPNSARRVALERVRQVDAVRIKAARRAAVGLVRAVEYGIDRYPAVVFDAYAVVYGVTDIGEALRQYRVWRGRAPR